MPGSPCHIQYGTCHPPLAMPHGACQLSLATCCPGELPSPSLCLSHKKGAGKRQGHMMRHVSSGVSEEEEWVTEGGKGGGQGGMGWQWGWGEGG